MFTQYRHIYIYTHIFIKSGQTTSDSRVASEAHTQAPLVDSSKVNTIIMLHIKLSNTLQHTATHCNTLQHTVIQRKQCNTTQHAATTLWSKEPPPPGGFSLFSGFEMKNPEEEDPWRTTPKIDQSWGWFFRGGPLPPCSWSGNIKNRKLFPIFSFFPSTWWDSALLSCYILSSKVTHCNTLQFFCNKTQWDSALWSHSILIYNIYMSIYMYIYINVYTYIYIYIYELRCNNGCGDGNFQK